MAQFVYKVLDGTGAVREGRGSASDRTDLMRRLTAEGCTLLRIDELDNGDGRAGEEATAGASAGSGRGIPAKVLETFTRQVAALLAAGVPLATALRRLVRETGHKRARQVWQALHDLVADGNSLADSMARFPAVFPTVYTAMVRAGETGGFLELVLAQIADFQSRERDLKAKMVSAMIYPCVLVVLSVAVVIFLLTFFIPRFEGMFADFGGTLPALTQGILGISDALRRWGPLALLVALAGGFAFRQWLTTVRGRRRWEGALLEAPVFGRLIARFAMTRFCRMLGTLVGAGVPLVTALNVASRSLGNQVLLDAVREAVQRVQRGSRLADSLAECPVLFPGSVIEIISVAEQTSRLDEELVRLAEESERELDRQLQATVALAEPAMLFVMAIVVGTIVIGMILPVFTLEEYIR